VKIMIDSLVRTQMLRYFTARNIRTWENAQADLMAWDAERNAPILIEVKQYNSRRARFTLAHELGHLELSQGHSWRTDATSDGRHAEWLDPWFAKVLASFPDVMRFLVLRPASGATGASEDSQTGVQPYEPVWLSWARDGFKSRLGRPPAQVTVGVPAAHDWTTRKRLYLHRLSVRFGTTQLARDYRAARLHLASSLLAVLWVMLARLVSASARRPKTPAFLLAMLATARRYGHRSEPDDHSFLALVLKPTHTRGAACLVT